MADRILTDTRIHRAPDCAITCREHICLTGALSPPIKLSVVDKLDALRRLDQFRQWGSLDEKRFCLVCGKIITGRQIQVAGGTRGNGPLRLSCPTERCNSIPMDWVLPTDENLAVANAAASEERNVARQRFVRFYPITQSSSVPIVCFETMSRVLFSYDRSCQTRRSTSHPAFG